MRRSLLVIYAAVTLDTIGIGLIFPLLPSLLRELTGSGEVSLLYGVVLSIYAAMQFLFAPVLGALSDRYGRRPVLLASMVGAALDYLVMAVAPSVGLLILSRAIAGLTSASFAVATAYLADISSEEERADRFGKLNAVFGLGFIIGPVLGGLLGAVHLRAPFLMAAALLAANAAFAWRWLPESRPGQAGTFQIQQLSPVAPLRWALGLVGLRPVLLVFGLLNFAWQVYGAVWALYGEARFGWSTALVGLSFTFYGACHALAQGGLTAPAMARLGARGTVYAGVILEGVTLLAMSWAGAGWMVFALIPLMAVSGVSLPALQTLLSNAVDEDHQGAIQGVMVSAASLATVVGPLFFAVLYGQSPAGWPGLVWAVPAALYLLATPLFARLPRVGGAASRT